MSLTKKLNHVKMQNPSCIKKSQRLSQYLGLISDLVQYNDVSSLMVELGALSPEEHALFQMKLGTNGNSCVMNELLTMVNLRRGGLDTFLQALKKTDYDWVAEQLNPGNIWSEAPCCKATKSTKMQNLLSNVRHTMNGKSGPTMSDSRAMDREVLTFMSYRDSIPLDNHDFENNSARRDTNVTNIETALELMNMEVGIDKADTQLSSSKIVVVENVPASNDDSTAEYFRNLAERLDVPPTDLKVIRNRKISKKTTKKPHKSYSYKHNNVKLEFQSAAARNLFIQSFNEFIACLEPSDKLYNTVRKLSMSVPEAEELNIKSSEDVKKLEKRDKPSCSKPHWYQRRFNIKSWRKKKE